MKKLALALVLLLTAGVLLAGDGKSCDMKKSSVKKVELTGTLACREGASGEDCARVFRLANAPNTEYSVCEKSKANLAKLSENGNAMLRIKGKLVKCNDGQELMITEASKI